ncbi:MAG: tetratricopeptide repeat protein [Methanomicrobiales archaeon]|nr:tetratricopeptide repeat protein [Methanomicrobiales archaeon]
MMTENHWGAGEIPARAPDPGHYTDDPPDDTGGAADQHIEDGFWAVMENQFPAALVSFTAALHADPASQEALYGSAFSLMKMGQYDRAEKVLSDGLALYPESRDLLEELGVLYHLRKQYGKAVRTFDRALATGGAGPETALWKRESLYRMGLASFDQGDYLRAIQAFDHVLSLDRAHGDAMAGRVAALRMLGRRDEAFTLSDQFLAIAPRNAGLHYQRGWLLMDAGRLEDAEVSFREASRAAPRWAEPVLARAEALERLQRGFEAVPLLHALEKAHPGRSSLEAQLGWYHLRRHDRARARKVFLAITEKGSDPLPGISGLAAVYVSLGRLDEAQRVYRTLLASDPQNPRFLALLAGLLTRKGDPASLEEAQGLLHEALVADPTCEPAFSALGVLAFVREQMTEAEEWFQLSIRMNPRGDGHRLLGALYAMTGRLRDAGLELARAVEFHRHDTRALLVQGSIALMEGRAHQAAALFRRAEAADPEIPEPPRALAAALSAAGNPLEAERVLIRSLARLDREQRVPLLLALADVHMAAGDRSRDPLRYRDALRNLDEAKMLAPANPDVQFREGILYARLGDLNASMASFRQCLKAEGLERYAERNLRLLADVVSRTRFLAQPGRTGRIAVAGLSAVQLAAIWGMVLTGKLSEASALILSPLLTVLIAVVVLVPVKEEPGMKQAPELAFPTEPLVFPPEWDAPIVWPAPSRPALRG